jgi:hypothetical protein
VLQTRECALTPSPFVVFTFGLVVESIEELGGASMVVLQKGKLQTNSCHLVLMVFQCFKLVLESKYINALLNFWLFGNFWLFSFDDLNAMV